MTPFESVFSNGGRLVATDMSSVGPAFISFFAGELIIYPEHPRHDNQPGPDPAGPHKSPATLDLQLHSPGYPDFILMRPLQRFHARGYNSLGVGRDSKFH